MTERGIKWDLYGDLKGSNGIFEDFCWDFMKLAFGFMMTFWGIEWNLPSGND